MEKKIICIPTCHKYVYPAHDQGGGHRTQYNELRSNAIRNTWYKIWEQYRGQIDLKFFYGRWPTESTRCPDADEIFLDAGDDYYSLPEKVQKMFAWALDRGYDRVLKVDDDVFLYVDRLLNNPCSDDYRGYLIETEPPYASGTAYWLSRRAMEAVVAEEWNPVNHAEDKWVGRTLAEHKIKLIHDERYHCCHCDHCMKTMPETKRISSHTVDPQRMYDIMESLNG